MTLRHIYANDVSPRSLRVYNSDVHEPAARCNLLMHLVTPFLQAFRHCALEWRINLEAADVRIVRHCPGFGVGKERAQRAHSGIL